jgi:hypothetical protein
MADADEASRGAQERSSTPEAKCHTERSSTGADRRECDWQQTGSTPRPAEMTNNNLKEPLFGTSVSRSGDCSKAA